MDCRCWDRCIREDHETLDSQAEALKFALEHPSGPRDRRVAVGQILRSFGPRLESHLWKEEHVFFPALRQLLGSNAGMLDILLGQHSQLREHLQRLTDLLEDPRRPWEEIAKTGQCLVELLEDHEEKEGRFLLEILEFSLQPEELMALARQFRQTVCQPSEELS